ncbi:UNKNOWN [Stylonychia lemnae]|uniref:Uncharacterized protein n=1 Tax=Stylonychia lemnae TaxID=5949 RepID=A0A078A8U0_STYLE|nr:UNKNOWN [Stylonychia lemnae]|eukprot:CDW77957.1 UNKNOWN [Stylonychia lemnae]
MNHYAPRIVSDKIYSADEVYDKTNSFQRLLDVPFRSLIPEHLRGHNKYGNLGNQNKFIYKGAFLYKPTRDGLQIV